MIHPFWRHLGRFALLVWLTAGLAGISGAPALAAPRIDSHVGISLQAAPQACLAPDVTDDIFSDIFCGDDVAGPLPDAIALGCGSHMGEARIIAAIAAPTAARFVGWNGRAPPLR